MRVVAASLIFISLVAITAFASGQVLPSSSERGTGSFVQNYEAESYVSRRAKQNWQLNCQGCHLPSGGGRPDAGMPDLRGSVSKFLQVEGGREYLMQVPGIVNSMTPNDELAELIDWTLITFDPDNIPQNYKAFTGEELASFRKRPLATKAHVKREDLINKISQSGEKK